MTPIAGFKRPQAQRTESNPQNPHDRQTEQGADLTNLAFTSLAHDHPQPGALARTAFEADICRSGFKAIFKHDPAPPGGKLLIVRPARDQHPVNFEMPKTRMG
jgi:hypothetical protein